MPGTNLTFFVRQCASRSKAFASSPYAFAFLNGITPNLSLLGPMKRSSLIAAMPCGEVFKGLIDVKSDEILSTGAPETRYYATKISTHRGKTPTEIAREGVIKVLPGSGEAAGREDGVFTRRVNDKCPAYSDLLHSIFCPPGNTSNMLVFQASIEPKVSPYFGRPMSVFTESRLKEHNGVLSIKPVIYHGHERSPLGVGNPYLYSLFLQETLRNFFSLSAGVDKACDFHDLPQEGSVPIRLQHLVNTVVPEFMGQSVKDNIYKEAMREVKYIYRVVHSIKDLHSHHPDLIEKMSENPAFDSKEVAEALKVLSELYRTPGSDPEPEPEPEPVSVFLK